LEIDFAAMALARHHAGARHKVLTGLTVDPEAATGLSLLGLFLFGIQSQKRAIA
jgi:hypothetical protein